MWLELVGVRGGGFGGSGRCVECEDMVELCVVFMLVRCVVIFVSLVVFIDGCGVGISVSLVVFMDSGIVEGCDGSDGIGVSCRGVSGGVSMIVDLSSMSSSLSGRPSSSGSSASDGVFGLRCRSLRASRREVDKN